jgi:hypothetical protein
MNARSPAGSSFGIVIATLMLAGASVGIWQWQQAAALRVQIDLARLDVGELARMQTENDRLRAKQIAAAELERLRADHAALPRLRAEFEALKKQTAAGR